MFAASTMSDALNALFPYFLILNPENEPILENGTEILA
jgi:hypothetical protein